MLKITLCVLKPENCSSNLKIKTNRNSKSWCPFFIFWLPLYWWFFFATVIAVLIFIHFFRLKHIVLVLKLNKTQLYWLTHSCLYGVDMTSDMRYWNKWFTRALLSFFFFPLSLQPSFLTQNTYMMKLHGLNKEWALKIQ